MACRNFWRCVLILQFVLSAGAARANTSYTVQVYWGWEMPTVDGRVQRVMAPPEILNAVRACGIEPRQTVGAQVVPAQIIFCPKVIDFRSNDALIAQLRHYLAAFPQAARLREEVSRLTLGISRHLIFVSTADGMGDERKMGINIPGKRIIVLNKVMWDKLTSRLSQNHVLLHEALMALGYDDSQYQISSAYISGSATTAPKKFEPKRLAGAYVAGHGGETTGAYFKASLLKAIDEGGITVNTEPPIPERFRPSKALMRETIRRTPVTLGKLEDLRNRNICDGYGSGVSGDESCGGFLLGQGGNDNFLLIPNEFGTFSPPQRNHSLLVKIYAQLYIELARKAGFR